MTVGHREHVNEMESALLGDASTRDPAVISSWRRCNDLHNLDPDSQCLSMQLVCAWARRVELANLMVHSATEWVFFLHSPELLDVDTKSAIIIEGGSRIIGSTR